jgi:single-strand DNA-binding protein
MQKNRIEVAGYLAAKPEVRFLPSGTPVANARLGESYTFRDGGGKQQKHTNWHSLSFYGDLSSLAAAYDKGDNLFVEGSVEQRQFTPNGDGVKRTVHEIIVRSCHLIAQTPATNGKPAASDSAMPERERPEDEQLQPPENTDDPWPVR